MTFGYIKIPETQKKLLTAVVFLFCFCTASVSANPIIKINADKQFLFAEQSFLKGHYLQAVYEYRRFIHFFAKDNRKINAIYKIGLSFFSVNQFENAKKAFQQITEQYPLTHITQKAYFMLAESHIQTGSFGQALITLNNLIKLTSNKKILDKAYYKSGMIYIQTGEFEKAKTYFSQISSSEKKYLNINKINQELNKQIKTKNPKLAGFLAVIPGAGHVYCGRYKDAFISLVLNTAFIFAAYESFDDNKPATGTFFSITGFGFYAGNIYGAANAAHKYNRRQFNNFIQNLKINIQTDPQSPKDMLLSVEYRF